MKAFILQNEMPQNMHKTNRNEQIKKIFNDIMKVKTWTNKSRYNHVKCKQFL